MADMEFFFGAVLPVMILAAVLAFVLSALARKGGRS